MKCISYDYAIGDKVYVTLDGIKRKFDNHKEGPYPVTQVYTNCTLHIQGGSFNERINIRCLEPHFDK